MSITETFSFDKDGEVVRFPLFRKFFLALIIVLIALLAFGIGRLTAGRSAQGVSINYSPALEQGTLVSTPAPTLTTASVYASSQGTKYYYSGCKSSVSERNKVTFASASEAEAAGYSLATNCKAP